MASSSSRRTLGLVIASAAFAAVSLCGNAEAQLQIRIGPVQVQGQVQIAGAADDVPTPDQPDGVFVRESPAAMDTFRNGQRMERLKEWGKAADFYQEVMEKYRDRVIPSAQDADHHATQYTSIVKMVQEQICKWPAEGRAAYLTRYEVVAQDLLNGRDRNGKPADAAVLHQVYERYFATESGKQAGIRLMDGFLESGAYRAAAVIGERLITSHPGIGTDAAGILYRTALAYHFAGNASAASGMLAKLQADHPLDHGTIRGKDVVLLDSLGSELKEHAAPARANTTADADYWPMPVGDPARSRISSGIGKPGVHLFSIALSKPSYGNVPGLDPATRQQLEAGFSSAVAAGNTTGVMPVVDHGDLFFQDGQKIYARSLESNLPLPGWAITYPAGGDYVLSNNFMASRTVQTSLTVTQHEVLAVMGRPDRGVTTSMDSGEAGNRLVCLNRETGKENWISSPSRFPESAAGLRDVELSGSPLVIGQSVLLLGHGGASKGVQFDDTYVISFDLQTGKYQWSCYIASANIGVGPQVFSGQVDETSHLAYADGLVYAQTNLGAIAAVDPFSQSLVWVDVYPTRGGNMEGVNPFQPMIAAQAGQGGSAPWTSNPVIAADGAVFTLPASGKSLLVYDSISGALLKDIPLSDLHDCDTLLGIVDGRAILTGQKSVVGVDWKKYDPKTFAAGDLNYYPFAEAVRGRGFITAAGLFVPVRDRLYWLDPKVFKELGEYPAKPHGWDDGQGPGNVVVTNAHVIVAGATSVDVYTDLALARANLDRVIAANPSDPEPHLRYAVLMFGAKDPDAALQRLDEAVALLGGTAQPAPGPGRNELFGDAMAFATALTADERPEMHDRAAKFFERAQAAASTPLQQIHARLGRAHLAAVMTDPVTAVKVYQSILSDENLRPVSLPDPRTSAPTQAGALAEKGIAVLIKGNPQPYAPFEQAASDALAEAKRSSDDLPARLLAVSKTYPNSSAAPQAMLAAADAYEAAGNPRMALQAARQLYFRTPDGSPDRAGILEAMARNYLVIPGRSDVVAAAAARLAQGAALPGDSMLEKPLRLPNNRILDHVHFSQALEEVRKYSGDEAVKALPDFRMPLQPPKTAARSWPGSESDIADIAAIVRPLREQSRFDRLVVMGTNGKAEIFVPGHPQPLAIVDLPAGETPIGCAWMGSNILIWSDSRISMFREDGGPVLWTQELKALPKTEIVHAADSPSPAPEANAAVANANNLNQVMIRQNGRLIRGRFNMRGMGRANFVVPVAQPPQPLQLPGGPERITQVLPIGDHVLLATTGGRIVCSDLAQGAVVWQMHVSDLPISRLIANEDFAVALFPDGDAVRLVAIDSFSGEMRGSRSFVGGQSQYVPINMALAADGTLVYTLPDRLCLKNLYTPWPDPSDREVVAAQNTSPFRAGDDAPSRPDQLVIAEGRILALADDSGHRIVRIHSLETGQPIQQQFTTPQGKLQTPRQLEAGSTWDVSLRVVGSHLYVIGPDMQASYNLDNPEETWKKDRDEPSNPPVHDAFIGKNHLLLIDGPVSQDEQKPEPPAYSMRAVGLYPFGPEQREESGRIDYLVPLKFAAGLTGDFQGFTGGFCYLTADHHLHVLMGAAQAGN